MRETREAALRAGAGRDFVVVKAAVVDAELAALGLHLRAKTRAGRRRLLEGAFAEGEPTGLEFEHTPGVRHAG